MDSAPPRLLLLLLLGGLWVQTACGGGHFFGFFSSSVGDPDVPEFSAFGYVNGVMTGFFSSDRPEVEARSALAEKIQDPQFWEEEIKLLEYAESRYRVDLRLMMNRFNQTDGFHIVQVRTGCELRDDGSTGGSLLYAYDGEDYLSFDKDRMTFVAATDAARFTADFWNDRPEIAEQWKTYLEQGCMNMLRKYLQYGAESLQRREPPRLLVSLKKAGDHTLLICYAYGFYPREIEAKWVRNGVEMPLESSRLLPNPDGTYQIKTTVEVQEGDDEKMYSCQVGHISLPEIVTAVYKEKSQHTLTIVLMVILGVLLLAGLILGMLIYKKKHQDAGTR